MVIGCPFNITSMQHCTVSLRVVILCQHKSVADVLGLYNQQPQPGFPPMGSHNMAPMVQAQGMMANNNPFLAGAPSQGLPAVQRGAALMGGAQPGLLGGTSPGLQQGQNMFQVVEHRSK